MKELIEKSKDVLNELRQIFEQVNEILTNDDIIKSTRVTKELEKTITSLQSQKLPVPGDLMKLKLDMVKKQDLFESNRKFLEELLTELNNFSEQYSLKRFSIGRGFNGSGNGEHERQKIRGYTLFGKKYITKKWNEVIVTVCEVVHSEKPKEFSKILNLSGRSRKQFSKNSNELKRPVKIKNTDIFIETAYGVRGIIKVSRKILEYFGFDPNSLTFDIKQ